MQQNNGENQEDKMDQTKDQMCKAEEETGLALQELNEVREKPGETTPGIDVALSPRPQTGLNSPTVSNGVRKSDEEANSRVDAESNSSAKDEASNGVRETNGEASSWGVDIPFPDDAVPKPKSESNPLPTDEQEDSKGKERSSKEYEVLLAEKQASLDEMQKEMEDARAFEADAMALLWDYKRRTQELDVELDKRKETEQNLLDSLAKQNFEIASLTEKLEKLQVSASTKSSLSVKETEELRTDRGEGEKHDPKKVKYLLEQMSLIDPELKSDIEEVNDSKARTLLEELTFLKNELKLAMGAEENSKKAMDDLALALKEVATEAHQANETVKLREEELQESRKEAEHLRGLLHKTEDTYKQVIEDTRREADRNKNEAERLRLEAEESLLAWNTETKEFVNCIKRAEEERAAAQEESSRLREMLKETEEKAQASKEEIQKLRDILKQAVSEANIAKEASTIAESEISQLKDMLGVRDEAIRILTEENETLKVHEAQADKNVKELKQKLAEAPIRELKSEEKEKEKEKPSTKEASKEDKKAKAHKEAEKEHNHKEGKNLNKAISFHLKDMIASHKPHKEGNEEAIKEDDDDMKGSIFDAVGASDSGPHSIDGDIVSSDEIDESQLDDPENNSRKRKALLRRFGDLIKRRGTHKKEPSLSNDERLANFTPTHS